MEKQELSNDSSLKKSSEQLDIDQISNHLSTISLTNTCKKSKKSKKKLPIYIGISINNESIQTLVDNSKLDKKTVKDEFHVTLVFKPTEENKNKIPKEGTLCKVHLGGIGYSEDAIAVSVQKILTESGEEVNYFLKDDGILHITIALADGIKPVNSYLAIKNGNYTEFERVIIVDGVITYY